MHDVHHRRDHRYGILLVRDQAAELALIHMAMTRSVSLPIAITIAGLRAMLATSINQFCINPHP
jgi:hypothetical protein